MLQVSALSKSYGAQTLFDNVTFALSKGERLGIIGRNGHGKSTLFRILLGQEEADDGSIDIPKGYQLGHLSQHLEFPSATVQDEAVSALPATDDGRDESYKALAILAGLGFSEEQLTLAPSKLSGGFQVRLNLAKLLVSEADLLLLDEPTNYLDIISVRWLIKFLRQWPGELMLITHDRSFMDQVTTHTMAIHRQMVRKIEGGTEKLEQVIEEEEEQLERTRENQLKARQQTEAFIRRFRSKASKAKLVQSRVKALERQGTIDALEEIDNLEFRFPALPFRPKEMLTLQDGSFHYPKGENLFSKLSLTIQPGERIAIVGKNGKGKSTLLRALAGELPLTEGELTVSEHAVQGYFGQTNIKRLSDTATVEEEILAVQPDHNRTIARSIAATVMFEGDLALKKVGVLSGGEKSRVMLGKLLATKTNLLLLDEPTNHLDIYANESLLAALQEYPGTVLFVSHDEMFLDELATRFIIFDNGDAEVFNGSYRDFLKQRGWSDEADSSPKGEAKGSEKGISKKEARRLRAQKLEELRPLKKKSEAIEKDISELEKTVASQTETLFEGTKTGYSDEMAKLSRELHQNKETLEVLYEELLGVMERLEVLERDG